MVTRAFAVRVCRITGIISYAQFFNPPTPGDSFDRCNCVVDFVNLGNMERSVVRVRSSRFFCHRFCRTLKKVVAKWASFFRASRLVPISLIISSVMKCTRAKPSFARWRMKCNLIPRCRVVPNFFRFSASCFSAVVSIYAV